MTDQEIAQKEAELRQTHPGMFQHPDLKHGEVIIEHQLSDTIDINLAIYNAHGVRARAGRTPKDKMYLPFIVNLRDLIIAEDALAKAGGALMK